MTEALTTIATWLVPLVIAIVFHEVSHGLVARALGDETAARRNRLSLNPLRHVDPVGTVILPMMLALAHAPVFGWAKPVPVRFDRLRNPRRDIILVALAGPGMNLLLAILAALLFAAVMASGMARSPAGLFVGSNLLHFLLINLFLAVFNLIPVPPFDGGHVVEGLLPPPLARRFARLKRFAFPILILLLLVIPSVLPGANIVARVVGPIVDRLAMALLSLVGVPAIS